MFFSYFYQVLKQLFTPYILIVFFLLSIQNLFSQNFELKTFNNDNIENTLLNSLDFKKKHPTVKNVFSEVDSIQLKLEELGYLNNRLDSISKKDSIYSAYFFLGKSLKRIKIFYTTTLLTKKDIFRFTKNVEDDYFESNLSEISYILSSITRHFENKGQSFTKVYLSEIKIKNGYLISKLIAKTSKRRKIDKIIINGYKKFPKTFLKHYLDLNNESIFSSKKTKELTQKIKTLPFVSETKPSEVLFTNDSTYLYLNLKKQRTNRFDGLIGFSSNENSDKLNLNGYLDLELNNILNSGEQISLNWKNNSNERQVFDLEVELPYIFNSAFTPKIGLNIYKQDSTFANTKANLEIGYLINYRSKLSLVYDSENSNNLLDNTINDITDYKSRQFGLAYSFRVLNDSDLFPVKFNLSAKATTGNRASENIRTNQLKLNLKTSSLWNLNYQNYIFIKNTSAILFSDDYLTNELFRIGGINSIRGFNEDSILAKKYSVINLEYRYITNNSSYLYTISDFGIINNNEKLYSLGLGYSFKTQFGVINLSYSNGGNLNKNISIENSRIVLNISSEF